MNRTTTILIVDDEPSGRETLEALLVNQGYALVFASNGAEALQQASLLIPDLVLLDVMMPGMDGFEVCQRLRTDPKLSEIPVMMVTALDDRDSRLQGIESGADDFISKPFDRIELRARIRTITRLNRYRRLLAERARFEWVVEQANEGFLILDENDTIHYANHLARRYLNLPGTEPGVIATEPFLTLVRKHYQCEPQEAWNDWSHQTTRPSALSSEDQNKQETFCGIRYLVRPETPVSDVLWLEVDRIDIPDRTQERLLVRLRDVTTQMTRQRQMWTFHALISHKLGTPLTGLINSLHLLQDEKVLLSLEEAKEFASIAFESAQRLRSQIQNIRAYMRTPDLAQHGEACHTTRIQRIVEQIQHELGLETVRLSGFENLLEAALVLSQQAVELMLQQVMENARKFHPGHTPVLDVDVSYLATNHISIRVADNGVSLSPEQLVGVWVPYYQAEKGFSGEVAGMGLGLAMVAALLWSVGGTYRMANREPGPGIEVELCIPLAHDEQVE